MGLITPSVPRGIGRPPGTEVDDGDALRAEVLAAARSLLASGAVIGSVGNVSARLDAGFLVTPTRRPYETMEPGDLVQVLADGTMRGAHPPSREWRLHAAVYSTLPEVSATVHTHSPHATAWSFLDEELAPSLEENEYYGTGPVLTVPPAPTGSEELAARTAEALRGSSAVLLGRHGVVATGRTPEEAAIVAAVVERQAQVAWLLRLNPV
jgi:L-fuculose-phosphate aldolase